VWDIAQRAALALHNARLYQQAAQARALAEEAARQREEFMAIASHELRTPITSVKAAGQFVRVLLHQPDVESADLRRYIDIMNGEVRRLEGLVSDLLDTSRLQRGRLQLRTERFDLVELARHVLDRAERTIFTSAKHRFNFDAPESVMGTWDLARLDQVLTNLLTNAVKYSPEGGTVSVGIYRRGAEAEVIVRDEGIGISREELVTLFQPFGRGVNATHTAGGSGLGLYIASQIVAQHGGEISVNSQPGQGSTFIVRLPLTATPQAEATDPGSSEASIGHRSIS
jgi:signal transduction histidine kinase